ncbi:DNA gyrase/topoisomerase IV subunit A [Phormidium sp. CCY1219]|uniref:DNA gyrase/topoisomerase IV subunit A n=1 Tax=Phormidium sp. CCY1219 TaxID=2886104 RepID=UPI002D1EE76C|nr:DNA topoisomerase (ATP-hydrolyzing) [Phormidium sp. CCY1219]MEB3830808.1 DNA topoisomerase 4 subunit A [Phormidium sp. CCY1219]
MAKQLNLLSTGQVIPTALHTEMQQSYLEYAMSVIVGRALPDVRDGLKPVHRRILYAMHELGLSPDRPYRKCARVVGDVLGKYHPHGDQAVYDAMVRMIQDFSSRYPLLAGHGNFGSVDNDPPAAMRYTETRLAQIGQEGLLREIGEATVDFIGNFDNSQQEPLVLPAQLPILLLNGCSGIAVGMATNVPPHNLAEVVDALIALIDSKELSDEKLFDLIPGPDFPTGGEIIDTEGIRTAYRTGRGIIPLRGVAQIEEIQGGRGRHRRTAIVVTELPFQVNKAGWIEKVADLVNHGRLQGISDIRDESDREGIRVVIELKRETNPETLLQQLYNQTPLQSNFGAILLALVDGQPRQLSLREMLQEFLKFREQTLNRLYQHELEQTENRLELVEGLLVALNELDTLIEILRNSADGSSAKQTLQGELDFSEAQADAILAMPMRRITGLEREKLQEERGNLTKRREELQRLLGDRRELLKALKKELRSLKKKYGDARRTRIFTVSETKEAVVVASACATTPTKTKSKKGKKKQKAEEAPSLPLFPAEPEPEETVLEFTHRGYVQRLSPATYERQQRGADTDSQFQTLEEGEDFTVQTQVAFTDQDVLILTRNGKAYSIKVGDIPLSKRVGSNKRPFVSLFPPAVQGDPEAIATQFILSDYPETLDLICLTKRGRIKRLPLSEFSNLTARGLTAVKLKEGDSLVYANLATAGQELVMATSGARLLRFTIQNDNLPITSRTTLPQQALRLGKGESLVGCVALSASDNLLLVSKLGYAKQLSVHHVRRAKPGDLGTQSMTFSAKSDNLMGMVAALPDSEVKLLTSSDRLLKLPIDSVRVKRKDDKGTRLPTVKGKETIVYLNVSSTDPQQYV